MKPTKVGVFSSSATRKKMAGRPMDAVRNRFVGATDIQSPTYNQKGPMKNPMGVYSGDVASRAKVGNTGQTRRRGIVKYSYL